MEHYVQFSGLNYIVLSIIIMLKMGENQYLRVY